MAKKISLAVKIFVNERTISEFVFQPETSCKTVFVNNRWSKQDTFV